MVFPLDDLFVYGHYFVFLGGYFVTFCEMSEVSEAGERRARRCEEKHRSARSPEAEQTERTSQKVAKYSDRTKQNTNQKRIYSSNEIPLCL